MPFLHLLHDFMVVILSLIGVMCHAYWSENIEYSCNLGINFWIVVNTFFKIYCWILFASILLRIFASMFIRDIGLYLVLFYRTVFIWFWYHGDTFLIEWVCKFTFPWAVCCSFSPEAVPKPPDALEANPITLGTLCSTPCWMQELMKFGISIFPNKLLWGFVFFLSSILCYSFSHLSATTELSE